jgi:multidrug efflux pump subunit AcrA (membrane-fusion protein)
VTTSNDDNAEQAQIEGLATLLVLDDEIRKLATLREFGFFSTNETHRLIPYHTGYLWQIKDFIGIHLVAQSGTAELDIQAPTNQWLKEKIRTIINGPFAKELHQFKSEELESDMSSWPEALPYAVLWCPLLSKNNQVTGGIVLFRELAFSDSEMRMLSWLLASYQYTWQVLLKPSRIPTWKKLKQHRYYPYALGALVGILLFPVHLSVFGSGTVAPSQPMLINSPLEGVIKSFAVSPGNQVRAGQLLITMEQTDLIANTEIDKKDLLLTRAKLRTAINKGFTDKASRAEIPILQAQLAIDQAHLDYTGALLKKSQLTSPIAGIVIFDSKEDWVGQPVRTGERILVVANPKKVQLNITVPVNESLTLEVGATGNFFLYGELNPLPVRVKKLGYNAKLLPNKILAYQLEADFVDPTDTPQFGAQGTVELYGQRVPLIYYLFRRPLQTLRQTLGI